MNNEKLEEDIEQLIDVCKNIIKSTSPIKFEKKKFEKSSLLIPSEELYQALENSTLTENIIEALDYYARKTYPLFKASTRIELKNNSTFTYFEDDQELEFSGKVLIFTLQLNK